MLQKSRVNGKLTLRLKRAVAATFRLRKDSWRRLPLGFARDGLRGGEPVEPKPAATDVNSTNNTGASLITTIIILTFIAVLGASQIAMTLSRLSDINLEADRLKAYYLAEAGFTACQYEMGTGFDSAGDGIGTIPFKRLGQGVYAAVHDFGNKTINATGIVNDVKRSIFVKYDSM